MLAALAATAKALPAQHPLTPDNGLRSMEPRIPLVAWHGLGDRYANTPEIPTKINFSLSYDSDGMKSVGTFLNDTIGPTYSYNIRLSPNGGGDRHATFFGNLTEDVAAACSLVAEDPILSAAPAINAVGFSQGGQFMRAWVETCNKPPVKNLVTFGSPHNGIIDFNNCDVSNLGHVICAAWESLLKTQTWTTFVQGKLVPAQYFRDPADLESYLQYSNWLADVNNEREIKNATYKENLGKLERFWMYKFSEDEVVLPKESCWFDEVTGDGEDRAVTKLKDRDIYKEDWLGLKSVGERDGLEFRIAEGGHMRITDTLLTEVFEMMYR